MISRPALPAIPAISGSCRAYPSAYQLCERRARARTHIYTLEGRIRAQIYARKEGTASTISISWFSASRSFRSAIKYPVAASYAKIMHCEHRCIACARASERAGASLIHVPRVRVPEADAWNNREGEQDERETERERGEKGREQERCTRTVADHRRP